jgi:hypothetical protein
MCETRNYIHLGNSQVLDEELPTSSIEKNNNQKRIITYLIGMRLCSKFNMIESLVGFNLLYLQIQSFNFITLKLYNLICYSLILLDLKCKLLKRKEKAKPFTF